MAVRAKWLLGQDHPKAPRVEARGLRVVVLHGVAPVAAALGRLDAACQGRGVLGREGGIVDRIAVAGGILAWSIVTDVCHRSAKPGHSRSGETQPPGRASRS